MRAVLDEILPPGPHDRVIVKVTWHGYATGTFTDPAALDLLLSALPAQAVIIEGHTSSRNPGDATFDWEREARARIALGSRSRTPNSCAAPDSPKSLPNTNPNTSTSRNVFGTKTMRTLTISSRKPFRDLKGSPTDLVRENQRSHAPVDFESLRPDSGTAALALAWTQHHLLRARLLPGSLPSATGLNSSRCAQSTKDCRPPCAGIARVCIAATLGKL